MEVIQEPNKKSKSHNAKQASLEDVRTFWDKNPLFSGEIEAEIGSEKWFRKLDQIEIHDVFAGDLSDLVYSGLVGKKVLEIGCGPGFLARQLCTIDLNYTGIDLAPKSIELAKKGHEIYGLKGKFQLGNAEALDFPDASFDHVVSIGVIHHTPNTEKCISEIYRVLKPQGTGVVSLYYKNWMLQSSTFLKSTFWLMKTFGFGLKGRGREKMWDAIDADELVRMYDGAENPVGKSYTREQVQQMFARFEIQDLKQYFFPVRALKINLPNAFQKQIASKLGLMIQIRFKKK